MSQKCPGPLRPPAARFTYAMIAASLVLVLMVGGITANKCSLGSSRLGLKSRPTNLHRANLSPASSAFHPFTHFVVVGIFLHFF